VPYMLPNMYRNAESTDLQERLRYYCDNKHTLLSHHDQHAADHSDETIEAMGRLTQRRWVRQLDKLNAQFQKECENREAGELSLPRMLGAESPVRTVPKRTRRTDAPAGQKIQTILNFSPITKIANKMEPQEGGTNAHGNRMRRPPAQRCAGVGFMEMEGGTNPRGNRMRRPPAQRCTGVSFILEREEKHPNDQVSTIPPAASRPVGLRSGGTNFDVPTARTGPTRHSGERILDVDTNT
jgi:hypothetical protein